MPGGETSAKNITTAERLVKIETQLADLITIVKEIQGKVNARDVFCAAQGPTYTNMAEKVQDHEARLDAVEKLMPAVRVVIWIGGGIGLSVIGFIWALIVGQVHVVFQ